MTFDRNWDGDWINPPVEDWYPEYERVVEENDKLEKENWDLESKIDKLEYDLKHSYNSICGYSFEEAYQILDDHRVGKYIPIEWIRTWAWEHCVDCYDYDYPTEKTDSWYSIDSMIEEWEKENEQR